METTMSTSTQGSASRLPETEEHMKHHLMTRPEAATDLGVSVSTLARWACLREKIRYHRVGKCALYDQNDLDSFIANSSVEPLRLVAPTYGHANRPARSKVVQSVDDANG